MAKQGERLFTIKINGQYVSNFDTVFENNDSKLVLEKTPLPSEAEQYNWFDLHFIIMNYTHADNWESVKIEIEKVEVTE